MRKKTLAESDLTSLNLEELSVLQASLAAKLILVNDELSSRWKKLATASEGLPNAEESKKLFLNDERFLRGFNVLLNEALAQITGNVPKN